MCIILSGYKIIKTCARRLIGFTADRNIDMSYLILLLSGFSSLYYEFLTLKYTEIHLGVSIFAVSIVLLTFLTGILCGNMLSRYFLNKSSNKRLIAVLIITEILIIPAVLLTPWLIELTSRIYTANVPIEWPLGLRQFIKYLLFLPAFLPLSILLGLRFPLYLKVFNTGGKIGLLYGISCLGSAGGAFAGGFFMFEYLNLYSSLIVCVCIAATLNIICLVVYYKTRLLGDTGNAVEPGAGRILPLLKNNRMASLLFFLLGLITIGMEVLWVRSLMRYFPNNRYVFSTITVALLIALFLGSISNRFFKPEKKTILNACLLLALSSQLCLGLQEYFNFFKYFATSESLLLFSLKATLITMLIAGIPGFIMGLLFPMLFNYSLNSQSAGNAQLAFLSVTTNSAGAICGALLFGMVLLNLAGCNLLITVVNLLIFIIPIMLLLKNKPGKKLVLHTFAIVLFAAASYQLFQTVPFKNYYLITRITGADADVEIFEEKDFDNPNRILCLNRTYISGGSGYIAERKQKKQGLLPVLLAPRKENALVISLATGITASAFADAEVRSIDCIELLPTSVKLSSYFQKENNNILSERNFKLSIDDARMFIKSAPRKYDIILSDNYQYNCAATPIMYSLETFADIRKIMSDNGIFIQWLPVRQIPPEHLAIIINTFRQVFPDGKLFFNDLTRDSAFLGLVAYKNGGVTYQQVAQNYQDIKNAASKSLLDNDIVCSYYICTVAEYCRMFPAKEINTYEHPVLEKYFTNNDFNKQNIDDLTALYKQNKLNELIPFNQTLADSVRRKLFVGTEPALYYQGGKQLTQALQELENLLQSVELPGNINTFYPEVSFLKGELCTALSIQSLTQGNLNYADLYFNMAESTIFRNSLFYRMKGILSGLRGDLIGAEVAFNRALLLEPKNYWVYESMALTYLHYGNKEKALDALHRALTMPYQDQAILRTAMNIYMRLDCYKDFLSILEEYMTLPDADKRVLPHCLKYLKDKGNTVMTHKLEKMLNSK